MAALQFRTMLSALLVLIGVGVAFSQPPKADEKPKKEEPPTKEELELRRGSRDLVYKFTVGEEFHCESRQKRTEVKLLQEKLDTDSGEITLKLTLTVASLLPSGGAELNGHVTRVLLDRRGRFPHKYDSDSTKSQDSEGWELYKDAKFKFKVDSRGHVSNISPDAETADYWKQQPRELRPLVSEQMVKAMLPFIPLPSDLVRRGTDWKEVRSLLDESFGKRDVTINFSYHGSETISGNTYEDIRMRGEAKQADAKPKFEIVDQSAEGSMSFDMRTGAVRLFRFNETYLFNPAGAPFLGVPAEKEEKKEKKAPGGRGAGGGYGGGSSGMSGGLGGGGRGGKGGGGQKKTKEQRKKEEDEAKNKPTNKAVKVDLETEVKVTYRGKRISGE